MALSLAEAELIGTLLEAMCYGMFLMLFLELLRVLYVRHRAGRSIKLLLVIALLIFSLITTDVVLQTNQVVEAFTDHMDVANAPVTYSITLSGHARMAKACIFMMLTLVCDALMVYRAFVVCESKYRTIALPSVLFLADIVLFAWFLWSYLNIDKHQTSLRTALIRIDYFYAVTLTLNLLCTVLISWKIWASHRKLSGSAAAGVRIMGVITIIIESAGVYSCILAALILTNALNTTVLCVILDPTYPVIGIIFSAVMNERVISKPSRRVSETTTPLPIRPSCPRESEARSTRTPRYSEER
ncbi:uncharacterized protein PHACADRAFT_252223 [Phanerochaete carnosa HHB-10118-sp]|uniref:THH1/TOM1/TOM3 domain-containing protein n=1 Tax=Phanerochaete carnosa (strain HHB-10118-sp) TaxID=650164 RepID=K5WFQ7_PHACS|nr:uncharacterized protein PHACADRAFT_252223 [Phanerochaete carnosa HHB-10118-sp]EKM58145.1 hypothetical protein PHACADRAFT_252223 [Phanerochaete carnosa HHB-10118-sp]